MIQRINHLNLEQKLGLMNEESQGMYDYNSDIKKKKINDKIKFMQLL